MTVIEKIGSVLSDPAFYEDHAELQTPEEIIEAVQQKVPEADREAIDAFLTQVSEQLQERNCELSEDDLEQVAGGIVITATVVTTVCGCITISATIGGIIGSAIWYWKNRKNR